MDQQQGFVNHAMERDDQMNDVPLQNGVQYAENNQAVVGHGREEKFVNQLINKDDEVTGWPLELNRLLVLCMKCFIIRKSKKIQTFIELFLPILIFIYTLKQLNSINPIDGKLNRRSNQVTNSISNNLLSNFPLKDKYPYSPLYYDLKNGSVDPKQLETFLEDAFSGDHVE